MSVTASGMRLLIDEHVPDSITNLFRNRGHTVLLVRDSGLKGEPDQLLAKAANEAEAIVVTFNHRHFAKLINRHSASSRNRYPHAGRISFRCSEAMAVERLHRFIAAIEREHADLQSEDDRRLLISISDKWFSLER